jgi:cytochrome c551/c552
MPVVAKPFQLFAASALVAACAGLPSEPTSGRAVELAASHGCETCHARTAPPLGGGRTSIAPAWNEIAARYRSDPGAEEALAGVLIGGTEERHWKGEPLVTMLPHEEWITPEEARVLVRWILARSG